MYSTYSHFILQAIIVIVVKENLIPTQRLHSQERLNKWIEGGTLWLYLSTLSKCRFYLMANDIYTKRRVKDIYTSHGVQRNLQKSVFNDIYMYISHDVI